MRDGPTTFPGHRGFTLVEILLVLALLVLGGLVLLPSAGAIFRRAGASSPEEAVGLVLQQARREAVLRGREVTLRFDPAAQRFAAEGFSAAVDGDASLRVEFLRPVAGGAVLVAGRRVETATVPELRFFPDGTCEPVRVQLRPAAGPVRIMTIDPWTCAAGLEGQP